MQRLQLPSEANKALKGTIMYLLKQSRWKEKVDGLSFWELSQKVSGFDEKHQEAIYVRGEFDAVTHWVQRQAASLTTADMNGGSKKVDSSMSVVLAPAGGWRNKYLHSVLVSSASIKEQNIQTFTVISIGDINITKENKHTTHLPYYCIYMCCYLQRARDLDLAINVYFLLILDLPNLKISHLLRFKFFSNFSANFYNPSISLWMLSQPSLWSATPPTFGVICKFTTQTISLRIHKFLN